MRDNRILIFGSGLIAERLQKSFKSRLVLENNSYSYILKKIRQNRPQIIINSTDYHGKNADDCEHAKDDTLMANAFFPITLAEVAIREKIKLVHIGSGCLYHYDYSKTKPINETAEPDFFDLFYNRTMIYADSVLELLSRKFDILIARVRLPLDDLPHPRNLLTKLISFKKVIREVNSITYVPDFVRALRHLIKINAKGVFNVVNGGGLYYPKLLSIYKKHKPDFKFDTVNFKELGIIRTNLVLSNNKLKKSGFPMPRIDSVLENCVNKYLISLSKGKQSH